MNFSTLKHAEPAMEPLSLREYLDFCWHLLKDADPGHLRRQKESEERIEKMFTFEGAAKLSLYIITALHPLLHRPL